MERKSTGDGAKTIRAGWKKNLREKQTTESGRNRKISGKTRLECRGEMLNCHCTV